jgi:hypothetical protein
MFTNLSSSRDGKRSEFGPPVMEIYVADANGDI